MIASSSGESAISAAQMTLDTYKFPAQRLQSQLVEANKTPLVLVACGSFSPITFLHLRMFSMTKDYTRHANTKFEVIGGYLSPVSDGYRKAGLAPSRDRVAMCELALSDASWVSVDPWEALQPQYVPTAKVLDHFEAEINSIFPDGVLSADGTTRLKPRVALLAGADLINTFNTPGVWSTEDLDHILGRFGAFIIERAGTDLDQALAGLQQWKDNIHVIQQVIQNNMSSTIIRLHIKRDMSVQYLIPDKVIQYIEEHGLYQDGGMSNEGDLA